MKKVAVAKKLKRVQAFGFGGDDDETLVEPVKKGEVLNSEQKALISKTASWVANNPSKAPLLIEKSRNDKNTILSFLYEPKTAYGVFYLKELARFNIEKEVGDVCNNPFEFGISSAFTSASGSAIVSVPSSIGFSSSGTVEEDQRMKKLIAEQQELQLLESRIREAASMGQGQGPSVDGTQIIEQAHSSVKRNLEGKLKPDTNLSMPSNMTVNEDEAILYAERLKHYAELAKRSDEKRQVIPEDEEAIIEGGTWEHRKRAREMIETASTSLELTVKAQQHRGTKQKT